MAEGPNPFVGPVEPFENFSHADLGSLVVVLKNGAPHSVHAPGKRLVRGLGLPVWGDLQVVQIRTSPVTVHHTVENIATAETATDRGWEIPSLTLALSVQVNPDGDFRAFGESVRRYGPAFGARLLDDLAAGVDQLIRRSLAPHGHEVLYTASLPALVLAAKRQQPIGDGALVLVNMSVEGKTWSPYFLQERSGKATTDATVAVQLHQTTAFEQVKINQALVDANVAMTQTRLNAQVLSAGLDAYEDVAARLGLTPYDLLHPEQLALRQDRAERLLSMLSEPGVRALFGRDPSLLRTLVAQATNSARPSAEPASRRLEAEEQRRSVGSRPQSQPSSLDLSIDARLRRALARVEPDVSALTGIEAASDGSLGIVLIISHRPFIDEGTAATLTSVLAPLLHVDRVTVLSLVADGLDDLVDQWFDAVVGATSLRAEVQVDDRDVVVIEVRGEVRTAQEAVTELNRAGNAAVGALENLLPHAGLEIRLGP